MIPPPEKLESYWTKSLCTLIPRWQRAASCSVKFNPSWICWPPAGRSPSISISQMISCCFPDSGCAEVWLVFSECGSTWCSFCSAASDSWLPTLWTVSGRHEPSSFLYIICCNKCATVVLRPALECRLWLWVAVCTPPQTHLVSLQTCLSVLERFSQVQVHFRVRWSISSIFQSEGVSSTVRMRSTNISSLKATFAVCLSHSGKFKCNIWPAFFALSFKSFLFLLHTSCDERKRRKMWANDFSGCQKHFFSFPAGLCHIIKMFKQQINKKKLSLYKVTVWTNYCSHHGSSRILTLLYPNSEC